MRMLAGSVLVVSVVWALFTQSCSNGPTGGPSSMSVEIGNSQAHPMKSIEVVESQIRLAAKMEVTRTVLLDRTIDSVFLVDDLNGWAASGNQSFMTRSAGTEWEMNGRLPLGEETVHELFFTDQKDGWIIATKETFGVSGHGSVILETADSGETWTKRYDAENIRLRTLASVDSELFAAGTRFSGFERSPVIYSLKDGVVRDHSESFKQMITLDKGNREELTGLIQRDGKLNVVTSRGRLYALKADRAGWELESAGVDPRFYSICACHAGAQKDKTQVWLAGGRGGDEGIGSFYAVEHPDKWVNYFIDGFYLSDIKVLPGGDVLVAGNMIVVEPDGHQQLRAAILRSSDGGASWQTIFQSRSAFMINEIQALDSATLLAVEDRKSLVRIEVSD